MVYLNGKTRAALDAINAQQALAYMAGTGGLRPYTKTSVITDTRSREAHERAAPGSVLEKLADEAYMQPAHEADTSSYEHNYTITMTALPEYGVANSTEMPEIYRTDTTSVPSSYDK